MSAVLGNRPLILAIGLSLGVHVALSWAAHDRTIERTAVLPRVSAVAVRILASPAPRPIEAPAARPPAIQPKPVRPLEQVAALPTPSRPRSAPSRTPPEPVSDPSQTTVSDLSIVPSQALAPTPVGSADDHTPTSFTPASEARETEDELLARYVAEIRRRVDATRRYPAMARRRSVEGRVMARIEIRADGSLGEVAFDRGAPRLLRRATRDAIRRAAPYPSPPRGAIALELPVDYSLLDAS